jgi:hypothetical protein
LPKLILGYREWIGAAVRPRGAGAVSKNRDKKKREQEKRLKRLRQRQANRTAEAIFPETAGLLPPEMRVIGSVPGMPKISDQLKDFVEPWVDGLQSDEAFRKLLTLGMVAWNAALTPPAERPERLASFLHVFGGEGTELANAFLQHVATLIQRKESDPRFANDRRLMVNFELTETPSGPRLQVLSLLPGEERR